MEKQHPTIIAVTLPAVKDHSTVNHPGNVTLAGAYRCACPLTPIRCTTPVGASGGICGPCSTGDHTGHYRMRGGQK